MIEITGSETTAYVMGMQPGELEDSARAQIEEIVDHPGFQNPIRIMPDVHIGKAAMVGFTMPLSSRVIPNVIGTDIGCGMYAVKIEDFSTHVTDTTAESGLDHDVIESRVRDRVPMGWGPDGLRAPDRDYYHIKNDFPWDDINDTLAEFIDSTDESFAEPMREFYDNGGYDIDYYKTLAVERAGDVSTYFDEGVGISSVGTLGSGNHFIEIARGEQSDDYWVVVHSGSRGLGENTAKYHQKRAITLRDGRADTARAELTELLDKYDPSYVKFDIDRVSDEELLNWLHGGMGEGFLNFNAIKTDYLDTNPERIEEIRNEFKEIVPTTDTPSPDESRDWLEGEEAAQYLIDMIFCQRYAQESRVQMATAVADELGATITDKIHAVHNFIDFRDQIIRKGATRSYNGERVVVPFNMKDGTLLMEGKSNPDWNHSVSHGSGRKMGRREAEETFTEADIRDGMDSVGAYAGAFPLDEAPGSYKDADFIRNAIQDTATVIDQLNVVHNFKADD